MRRRYPVLLVLAVAAAPAARAQVDLVDPDAKAPAPRLAPAPNRPAPAPTPAEDEGPDTGDPADESAEAPPDEAPRPAEPVKKVEPKRPEPKKPEPAKPAVSPLLVPRLTDADLDAAWVKWRLANAQVAKDPGAEVAARGALLQVREEAGAADLEGWAVALLRAAARHEEQGSSQLAVDQALAAVELAPRVPSSHFGLARSYFAADPTDLSRYLEALGVGARQLLTRPRYVRAVLGDVASALLLAVGLTAVLFVTVLFARRARYFFFDFHFLFPRAVPRWQSAAICLVLLCLPLVFRLGVIPSLLCAFAATTLYLSLAERLVAAALITLLSALPYAAGLAVRHTAFADTPAEAAWQLEAGAPGAEGWARKVEARLEQGKARFGDLFALGTFELHRGRLGPAIAHLKAALLDTPNEPRAQVNLGVALLLNGDLENPIDLFEAAGACSMSQGCTRILVEGRLGDEAAPWFDLGRLHQRRVQVLGVEAASAEIDKGNAALAEARARDASLASRRDPPVDRQLGNTWLMTLPLAADQLVALAESGDADERVRSQLSLTLLGDFNQGWASLYPLVLSALLAALGALSFRLGAARACTKCGQAMSRRDDPEVSMAANMCTQCVNVFAKKGVVPPQLKVRKQVEVARYQTRVDRVTLALGLLCSGLGHVFKGLPVRGALYAFLFLFALAAVGQRHGVLRLPFEGLPPWLKLAPFVLMLLLVWGLSARGLTKKQGA